ncbi:MAG: transposase [Opitutaceae bacterium]|nr:transposase [Opitutaceae bacterium]
MALDPAKGYRALRAGRYSEPGREYFVTFCTGKRRHGLTNDALGQERIRHWTEAQDDAVWAVRCATLMPDHVHLFVSLGQKLALGQAIARIKALSAAKLRDHELRWQPGYFEHHVRPEEKRLPYFLYTYLNPYRAKLITPECAWPWFVCGDDDREWFLPFLNQGLPEPAWLADLP